MKNLFSWAALPVKDGICVCGETTECETSHFAVLVRHKYSLCLLFNIIWSIHVFIEVSKGAKIRNRYNQVPHLTKNTNGKVKNLQLGTTNESQEVSPFPAGDHKAHINRRSQRHSKHKTEKIKDPQKSTALERSVKYFTGRLKPD